MPTIIPTHRTVVAKIVGVLVDDYLKRKAKKRLVLPNL